MVSAVQFYQVNGTTPGEVDAVLPVLLAKILGSGHRVVIRCPSLDRRDRLNSWLWTHTPTAFLPHGVAEDGQSEAQPVFLTTDTSQPNEARTLILLGGMAEEELNSLLPRYDKVLDLFDSSPTQTEQARRRWKQLKELGVAQTYFAQTEKGWQKRG